jgi:pimeloyl-ACP methyl ester carboxylesterase
MPFTYAAPESALEDLRQRLARARSPERETVNDWSQGVPLAKLRALVEYWRTGYDWRRCEAMLKGFGQYRTEIGGLNIHFLHARSSHANALPLMMTHGWPGSVIEFFKIIDPLIHPTAHGGGAQDAFHVAAPSLPGFGFSDKPTERGWNSARINFLCMGVGSFVWGALSDRLGTRAVVLLGGVLLGLGTVMASQALTLSQFQVSFRVVVGFAAGSLYAPLTATTTRRFTRHRSLAVALVSAGLGLGSTTTAPLACWLITTCDTAGEVLRALGRCLGGAKVWCLDVEVDDASPDANRTHPPGNGPGGPGRGS